MRLGYNEETERYGILDFDLWENEGLHCGTGLEVLIDGKWVETRIEMKRINGKHQYYLFGTDLYGDALEGLKVRISREDD